MLLLNIEEKFNGLKRNRFNILVRLMIFIGIGLSGGTSLIAQDECGTVFTEQMKQEIRKRIEEGKTKNKKSNNPLVFKVKPYIMRSTNSNTPVPPSILQSKEDELNAAFADANIKFDFYPHNFLTCNSSYNINENEFRDLMVYRTDYAIPIFFCRILVRDNRIINGLARAGGIIALSQGGATNETTLIHEMGHYFGLPHTHSDNSDGSVAKPQIDKDGRIVNFVNDVGNPIEEIDRDNCQVTADDLCATPADYGMFNDPDCTKVFARHAERRTIETWEQYYPPITNYMSYYGDCRTRFANDQNTMMYDYADDLDHFTNDPLGFSNIIDMEPWFCEDVVIDDIDIDPEDTGIFECDDSILCEVDGTNNYLAINCNTVVIESGQGFIRPEFMRVSNFSENTVNDVNVVFKFVEHPNDLHTVTIGSIAAGNYFNVHHLFDSQHDLFEQGSISTNGVPNGQYTLELRLEYAPDQITQSQTFYVCESNQRIDVTQPPEDPCEETKTSRSVMPPNRHTTFEVSRYIELLPGFLADGEEGTIFTAQIEPCSNAVQDESEVIEEQALIVDNPDASSLVAESSSLQHTIDLDHFESFQVSNYPNPFSTESTIELVLNSADQVRIILSDVNGKYIRDVKEMAMMNEGHYQFSVDGSKYQPGVYYYTVIVGSEQQTGKMILIK